MDKENLGLSFRWTLQVAVVKWSFATTWVVAEPRWASCQDKKQLKAGARQALSRSAYFPPKIPLKVMAFRWHHFR